MSFDFTKVLKVSKVQEVFEGFSSVDSKWDIFNVKSTKYLRDYVSSVKSFQKNSENFEIYEKCRSSFKLLKETIMLQKKMIDEIGNSIETAKKEVVGIPIVGKKLKPFELTDKDFIIFMERILNCFQNEMDLKEIIFLGLHESEKELVLSSYLIQWETNVFQDQISSIRKNIETKLELNLKAKLI